MWSLWRYKELLEAWSTGCDGVASESSLCYYASKWSSFCLKQSFPSSPCAEGLSSTTRWWNQLKTSFIKVLLCLKFALLPYSFWYGSVLYLPQPWPKILLYLSVALTRISSRFQNWCALNVQLSLFIITHSQWSHNGCHEKRSIEFTYSNLYFAYKRIIACLQVLLIVRIKAKSGKL